MALEWRDEFCVGNPTIDGDHKTMVAIVNEYQTVVEARDIEGLKDIYRRLFDYASSHFDREISLQKAIHFPHHGTHQDMHDQLLEQLTEIHETFVAGSERKGVIPKTTKLLRDWLLNHVLKEDFKMRPYLTGERGELQSRPSRQQEPVVNTDPSDPETAGSASPDVETSPQDVAQDSAPA